MRGIESFTLKNILFSPLYTLPDNLVELFYKIRQMKEIKSIEISELEDKMIQNSSLRDNLRNCLLEITNKMNWCRNHLESDLNIEILPWLEAEELRKFTQDEILEKKEIIDKINKKIDIWERYISTILLRTRGKKPKGSGPYGEYEFWSKREDQIGPLLLTLYGKSVSRLLYVLRKIHSSQVEKFIAKRLLLKKYYETSKINKKYIWVCMCILGKINKATNTDEIKLVIPEFWKNLRYLWLLSGYWAVKTNIIRFIERVQYLIVNKCIRVLEVNNFFMIPQVIARQLAIDVIELMQSWKNAFYEVKAYIEMHQCEMRWEFPLHRIFNVTDYMGKLSADFCFLAESLNHYLDIFTNEFAKVVQDEIVIDTFVQRVKLLTMPLKTADFNIYDPENDVHWNLLMETFVRDLNSIQKESAQIINQSFKNLRSSVIAADLLFKLKGIDERDKCHALLMSKFEFVILQILKEIKNVSELIMNEISHISSHCLFLSKHSGIIYSIRELHLFMQFRFVYLSQIEEIQEAQTYHRALACFETFSKFYDICQLIIYVDWINMKKYNISCQLMKKVFKTNSVTYCIFGNESNKLISPSNIISTNIEASKDINNFNLNKKNVSDKQSEPQKNSISINKIRTYFKPIDLNDPTKIKPIDRSRIECNKDGINSFNKIYIYLMKYNTQLTEDEKDILKESQQQLLFLLHKEKEYLHYLKYSTELINGFGIQCRCDKEESVERGSTVCDTLHKESDIFNKVLHYKLFSFSNYIVSSIQPESYNTIIERIAAVTENIFHLSYLKKCRLLVIDNDATTSRLSPFHDCQINIENQGISVLSKSKENSSYVYLVSDDLSWSDLMFKTSTKCTGKFHQLFNCNKEDEFFPALNQIENETTEKQFNLKLEKGSCKTITNIFQSKNLFKNTIKQPWNLNCLEKIDKESIFQGNIGDSSMIKQKQTMDTYHVSYSDTISLLIERGLLIEINFDFHLCDLVMEIYHFAKLGLKLPGKFYGLALLKNAVLKDLKYLNYVSAKYNSLIFCLQKEELLSLKLFIHDFEYLLTKGLKYYSWYTIKAGNFCDTLSNKLSFIYSFKESIQNIAFCIQNILLQIKVIDWFDFPEPVDEINFKSIKDFFEELEAHRRNTFNQMLLLFAMITPLFLKMEYLILKRSTGKNQYLQLFYKCFEEKILETLVINLLRNIKKFKYFLLGNEFYKFQLTLTTIPDVIFDFHTDQCSFFLKKSLDQLLLRYRMIPRWQVGSCVNVIYISSGVMAYKNNYLEDITKFKIVAAELIEIQQLICLITFKCSEYLKNWQQLNKLWVFEKESSTESFLEKERKLVDYCDFSLLYYDQFLYDIKKHKKYIDLHCIR
ncbi:uncharacterized protein [Halyomorpha halys]|uniref:uncharacterized protein n=1 Tax=Halyomorpha halys TaxID=286706 RepID=UPI0034D19D86